MARICILLCAAAVVAASSDLLEEEVVRLRAEVASLRRALGKEGDGEKETCNHQGYYYDDVAACRCFQCFVGTHCEGFNESCTLDDGAGNPYLFEEYWRNSSAASTELIYYRSPYQRLTAVLQGESYAQGELLPALKEVIMRLHAKVGNIAHLDRKSLVIGSGATQLIGAATWACKQLHAPTSHLHVYARPPYYNGYSGNFASLGATNISFTPSDTLDPSSVLEFVTYPNNPDMRPRTPQYKKAACVVHDQVYWWPSITNLTEGGAPLDTSISLFSMSKLTGHAATRLGWALVDDPQMAQLMAEYVEVMQIHVSIDSQYRTLQLLKHLLDVDELRFFGWVHHTFQQRWERLLKVLGDQSRFKQHARPGGFYAWIECLHPADRDCYATFLKARLGVRSGTEYGGLSTFVRLELVQPDAAFDKLLGRLRLMVE